MKEKDEKLITKVANFENKIKKYLEYQEYLKMEAVCFDLHGELLSQRRIPKLNAPLFFFYYLIRRCKTLYLGVSITN